MAKSAVNPQQLTSSPWTLLLFHSRGFPSTLTTFSTCIQGSPEHSQGQLSGTNGWKLVAKDLKFPVAWWDKSLRILHGVPENAQLGWPLVALHVNRLINKLHWLFSFPCLHFTHSHLSFLRPHPNRTICMQTFVIGSAVHRNKWPKHEIDQESLTHKWCLPQHALFRTRMANKSYGLLKTPFLLTKALHLAALHIINRNCVLTWCKNESGEASMKSIWDLYK